MPRLVVNLKARDAYGGVLPASVQLTRVGSQGENKRRRKGPVSPQDVPDDIIELMGGAAFVRAVEAEAAKKNALPSGSGGPIGGGSKPNRSATGAAAVKAKDSPAAHILS